MSASHTGESFAYIHYAPVWNVIYRMYRLYKCLPLHSLVCTESRALHVGWSRLRTQRNVRYRNVCSIVYIHYIPVDLVDSN
jgi:hypothetical protein